MCRLYIKKSQLALFVSVYAPFIAGFETVIYERTSDHYAHIGDFFVAEIVFTYTDDNDNGRTTYWTSPIRFSETVRSVKNGGQMFCDYQTQPLR